MSSKTGRYAVGSRIPGSIPGNSHIAIESRPAVCDKHGDYDALLWALDPASAAPYAQPFWSKCSLCDDEIQAEQDARSEDAKERQERWMSLQLDAANIPPRFRHATVWGWQHGMEQQQRAWAWARDYCGQFEIVQQTGRSGLFTGAPGTGKTHLAVGILRHILEKGGTGYYTTVMGLLGRIKDTYHREATETEQQVIDHVRDVDLLVIDEVGRQLDTNYEHAQLFRILDLRYGALRPTLLVSNLSREKLGEFLGEAMVDRMREGGGGLLVFDWASQRPRKPSKES